SRGSILASAVRPAPAGSASARPHNTTKELACVSSLRMTDPAVEVRGLTKRYGDIVAVDNVDLVVPRACAFGYLGPNGAGKTTLIKMLLGLTRANAGEMRVLGRPVPEKAGEALARVGAIVEEPRFH